MVALEGKLLLKLMIWGYPYDSGNHLKSSKKRLPKVRHPCRGPPIHRRDPRHGRQLRRRSRREEAQGAAGEAAAAAEVQHVELGHLETVVK